MAGGIDEVRTSTNYDPQFTLESMFKEFEIGYEDGTVDYRRDYVGNSIVRFIKRIKNYEAERFDGSIPFTTWVYQKYGSTTAIWVVMLYNGFHPLEIIPGTVVKFPDLTELVSRFQRQRKVNNIGKTTLV